MSTASASVAPGETSTDIPSTTVDADLPVTNRNSVENSTLNESSERGAASNTGGEARAVSPYVASPDANTREESEQASPSTSAEQEGRETTTTQPVKAKSLDPRRMRRRLSFADEHGNALSITTYHENLHYAQDSSSAVSSHDSQGKGCCTIS